MRVMKFTIKEGIKACEIWHLVAGQVPWNMVIQGHNFELIDWDDYNALDYMYKGEACWAHFEAKL